MMKRIPSLQLQTTGTGVVHSHAIERVSARAVGARCRYVKVLWNVVTLLVPSERFTRPLIKWTLEETKNVFTVKKRP
jgi:hypothetical protein